VVQASYDEPLPFAELRQRKRPTVQLRAWQPKDDFDPEIFNRQSVQAAQPASAPSSASLPPQAMRDH
jgi:hypothetical protein